MDLCQDVRGWSEERDLEGKEKARSYIEWKEIDRQSDGKDEMACFDSMLQMNINECDYKRVAIPALVCINLTAARRILCDSRRNIEECSAVEWSGKGHNGHTSRAEQSRLVIKTEYYKTHAEC